jgi:FMN reductase
VVDLSQPEWSLPLFDPKRAVIPPAFDKIKALMLEADGIVLASPDYHGGPSGVIKNFLDYYWGEMTGRLFGYVVASHEKALLPMEHLRTYVRQCYGWSLPYGVAVDPADLNAERSAVSNPKVSARLQMLAHDLVAYGPMLRTRFNDDKGKAGFAAFYK